jgi:hypothetical protein
MPRRSLYSYTPAIADRILTQLSAGRPLADICADAAMPGRTTVLHWVENDREGFAARYRTARESAKTSPLVPYEAATAERILDQLSRGRVLRAICGDPGMPSLPTVWQWKRDDREGFAARFRRACRTGGTMNGLSVYTAELAEKILDGLMDGRTLADICREPGMPGSSTVRDWAETDRDGFAARYATARRVGYATMMDELLEIADDKSGDVILRRRADGTIDKIPNPHNVARARIRLSARKWLISKSLPRNRDGGLNLLERIEVRDTLAELMKQIEQQDREAADSGGVGSASSSELHSKDHD